MPKCKAVEKIELGSQSVTANIITTHYLAIGYNILISNNAKGKIDKTGWRMILT